MQKWIKDRLSLISSTRTILSPIFGAIGFYSLVRGELVPLSLAGKFPETYVVLRKLDLPWYSWLLLSVFVLFWKILETAVKQKKRIDELMGSELEISIDRNLNPSPNGNHDFRGRVKNKGKLIKNAYVKLIGLSGITNQELGWENAHYAKIDISPDGEPIFDIANTSGNPILVFDGTVNFKKIGGKDIGPGIYSFHILFSCDEFSKTHDVKIQVNPGNDATKRVTVLRG